MRKIYIFLVFILGSVPGFGQYRVILDADIDSDVDDVEALAMLHNLDSQKKINFIGVIVTSDDPFAPLCVSSINNYFGTGKLPIGFLKNQPILTNHSKYTKQLAEEYPHKLKTLDKTEEGTTLYRKLLSKSPDESVVIITIGHLTSLQNLLKSGPDKYSKLTGKELVEKKVAKWLCMGGNFPNGPKEANFYRPDPGATVYCVQEFPKPVIFAGWEVGIKIQTGGEYLKSKLTKQSPVYRAYELYNNFKGRASWDQVIVLMLLPEATIYFDIIKEGYCQVYEDGSNKWLTNKDRNHEYVIFKPNVNYEEVARLIDNLAIK